MEKLFPQIVKRPRKINCIARLNGDGQSLKKILLLLLLFLVFFYISGGVYHTIMHVRYCSVVTRRLNNCLFILVEHSHRLLWELSARFRLIHSVAHNVKNLSTICCVPAGKHYVDNRYYLKPFHYEYYLWPFNKTYYLWPFHNEYHLRPFNNEYYLSLFNNKYNLRPYHNEYYLKPFHTKYYLRLINKNYFLWPFNNKYDLIPFNNEYYLRP